MFHWRAALGFGKDKPTKLTSVMVAGGPSDRQPQSAPETMVLYDLLPMPDGMVAIDLPDERRVFAPADADPDAVRRRVAE